MELWIQQRWGHVKSKNELIEQQVPVFAILSGFVHLDTKYVQVNHVSFFLVFVFFFLYICRQFC